VDQRAPHRCQHGHLNGLGPQCYSRCLQVVEPAPAPKFEAVEAPSAGVKQVLNARSAGRGPGRVFSEATGRAAGLRGGTARAKSLAPEQRQDIARRGATARWGGKAVGS
jgi:hypothetical protein